jgi:DinB family protein
MTQPLVTQLKFTRSEWVRGLKPVTAEESTRRFGSINPIAWMIGHLAWQEQLYWVERAQDTIVVPEVKQFGYGKPLTVPPLDEAWAWWRTVTRAADRYLDGLAGAELTRRWKRESSTETPGTKLHRTTYHYWFHLGESQAVRQLLGHTRLPTFVGGFGKSQYRPEIVSSPTPAARSRTRASG